MTDFDIVLDDSAEPVTSIHHRVTIEWNNDSAQLEIVETEYDARNASFNFGDIEDAEFVAGELNMSTDNLMDECVGIIYKNGR